MSVVFVSKMLSFAIFRKSLGVCYAECKRSFLN